MKSVVIAGRLGRDAELRRTQGGEPVLNFSVAVDDRSGKDKAAVWFDVSVWGKRAEGLAPHLTKGTAVAVSGDLGRREHEGRTYLTVRANEVTLLGGGEKSGQSHDDRARTNSDRSSGGAKGRLAHDLDDDIPF